MGAGVLLYKSGFFHYLYTSITALVPSYVYLRGCRYIRLGSGVANMVTGMHMFR